VCVRTPRSGFCPDHESRVPHIPGFPAKFSGADELHAAFLDESRTCGTLSVPRIGNPGISLVFCEMWDTTAADLQVQPSEGY
jgi:hypothetical protein